ncbi:Cell division trigger factor [uncultured Candidatus Thioglobus sp.]|nr:Cell division trigger factor [uncultured Candidatus Thioglobus sp.]
MKTSLKTLDGLKRSLTVELPADTFKQKVDQLLKKMASQANINGFRKGKVPVAIMRKQFGGQANQDAINDMVNETLGDAFTQEKITPAGRPTMTKADAADEKVFTYTVEFEIYPEIKVGDFSKLKIEQAEVKITKADEENTLKGLTEQSVEYKSVKRKSKEGDQITVDFKGSIDGEVFEGGAAEDFKMVLGKGTMIAGFEAGVTDVAVGEPVSLDLTFPKDYQAPQLAGKDVNFAIQVKDVAAPVVQKMDDKFAEKFGEKTMDELKKNMRKQMETEAGNRLANQNKEALFEVVLAANKFAVPQVSIDAEAQNLMKDMQSHLQEQGMPASKSDVSPSAFNDEAERRVKLGLLVNQISVDNKIQATKEELNAELLTMSKQYGEQAQQMIDYYNEDPTRMSSIELLVVEKKVQDLILSQATVTMKSKNFKDVTQQV